MHKGGGVANSGVGYAGLAVYVNASGFENAREYIEVELLSQLIQGKTYKVEFYVSLMDSCRYAINSLGACLTSTGIGNNLNDIFALTPQIQNPDTFFLAAKDKWMKISASFYANGTERYIAIGNFRNDQNTESSYLGSFLWTQAAYYLDDVSVTLDTTTGVYELEQRKFEVYPNPAKEQITIETEKTNKVTTLQITDITGREVFSFALTSAKTTIDLPALSAGVYTAILFQNEAITARKEIIIQR